MDTVKLVKLLIGFVTTTSVGVVVKNVVKHTAPFAASGLEPLLTSIGGVIIASVVGDVCSTHVEEAIFGEEKKE